MAWKYQKNQAQRPEYVRFAENEEKTLTISDWDFGKSAAGYLFRCFVSEENGKKVDKIWTIWDYESAQRLKKKLGKASGEKTVRAKMAEDDDEQTFEFS